MSLFAFEVPTPKGIVRIIAPEDLTPREARKAGDLAATVLRLSVIGEEPPNDDAPRLEDIAALNASVPHD